MSSDILSLIGLAKRASRLAVGEDMAQEAVAARKVRLLLLACDAAPGTSRRTRTLAGERIPVMTLSSTKAQLGSALGRESCAVCAVTDIGFAAKLAELIGQENPALAPVAAEIAAKREKMVRRKKAKPRKKN